jgi:hypothetical protein
MLQWTCISIWYCKSLYIGIISHFYSPLPYNASMLLQQVALPTRHLTSPTRHCHMYNTSMNLIISPFGIASRFTYSSSHFSYSPLAYNASMNLYLYLVLQVVLPTRHLTSPTHRCRITLQLLEMGARGWDDQDVAYWIVCWYSFHSKFLSPFGIFRYKGFTMCLNIVHV